MPNDGVMQLRERLTLDRGEMRFTNDGYLVAAPRVARTGIQLYSGDEVGNPDMKIVRVYRPEAEVFHADAMSSLAHRPITNGHPPEAVTADTWKKYSVGNADGNVVRDGEFVRVPMVLMDKGAIDEVMNGKAQLSVGYAAHLKWGSGKTPDGQEYDAMQTNIRANHIACVDMARGGPLLKIGDQQTETETMANENTVRTRILTIDGIACEMSDKDSQIVERHIKSLNDQLAAAQATAKSQGDTAAASITTLTTERDKLKAEGATKDAEIVTLKKAVEDAKLKPTDVDNLVRLRADTIGKGKAILGDKLVVDGKTDADIRRQVVDAKLADAAKGWSDEMVTASFNTMTADVKIDNSAPGNAGQSIVDAARAFSGSGNFAQNDPRQKAYADYEKELTTGWQKKEAVAP